MTQNTWDTKLYDQKHAFVFQMASGVIELLAPKAGERILDVGCGTGHLTKQIADAGAQVVGLDSAASMLDTARAAYPAIEFRQGDASDFTVEAPFDAVFSNATLHWVPRASAAASCMAAALKPGGRFVAEFGGHLNMARVTGAVRQAAREVLGADVNHAWFFPTIGEYAAILEPHGFEVRTAWLFDRPTPLEGEDGMRNWMAMFGGGLFGSVPAEAQPAVIARAEQALRATNYRDGAWFADYRRIRIHAVKTAVNS